MSRELALEGFVINDADYLVKSVFPDEWLLIVPTDELLDDISDVFYSVMHPMSEENLASWMNHIGDTLADCFKLSLTCKWDV
jgi:hypothetical protein